MQTKRVVFTSSTLYGVWDQPKMPDSFTNFEMEVIVGGWQSEPIIIMISHIMINQLYHLDQR